MTMLLNVRCVLVVFVMSTLATARSTPTGSESVVNRSSPLGNLPTVDFILYGLVNTAVLVHWRKNFINEALNGNGFKYEVTGS